MSGRGMLIDVMDVLRIVDRYIKKLDMFVEEWNRGCPLFAYACIADICPECAAFGIISESFYDVECIGFAKKLLQRLREEIGKLVQK